MIMIVGAYFFETYSTIKTNRSTPIHCIDGHPEDCWFHVDDLSSAHVYLRLKPGQTMDDIPEDCLTDCCSLVKANSIQGCKKSEVYIVYTRWKVRIISIMGV